MKALAGLLMTLVISSVVNAENFEYKVYFGLSKNIGAVSLAEWEQYESNFAKHFTGFTVTSAVGYYKGAKERSRLITLLMDECREPLLTELVRTYTRQFNQDSVLVSKSELVNWELVGQTATTTMNDTCEVED